MVNPDSNGNENVQEGEGETRRRKSHMKLGTENYANGQTVEDQLKGTLKTNSESEDEDDSVNTPEVEMSISNWRCCRYHALPKWLQDNEYIHKGYRPPLPSFKVCIKSIFRVHTETGNIWTHLLSCIIFILILLWYTTRPMEEIASQEKLVFGIFFVGAISCLGLSSTYHTVNCHSEQVGRFFNKLDYLGIALQIMGSFVPWLYYGFYCDIVARNVYMVMICVLGAASIVTSLYSKFGHQRFRVIRAGVFAGFGLSGVLPAIHFLVTKGISHSFHQLALGYLIGMAVLYLIGAALYAARIPERYYPGKCDLLFHSHQIFHVLVFLAAMVCYRGVSLLAEHSILHGGC